MALLSSCAYRGNTSEASDLFRTSLLAFLLRNKRNTNFAKNYSSVTFLVHRSPMIVRFTFFQHDGLTTYPTDQVRFLHPRTNGSRRLLMAYREACGPSHFLTREQMVFLGNPEYGVDLHPIDFAAFAHACSGAGFTDVRGSTRSKTRDFTPRFRGVNHRT
jgi:hypothetical protein